MANQKITDFAAAEGAKLDQLAQTLTTIKVGIQALDDQITQFQNSPGTLSADDQAMLDAIQAKSADLVTTAGAIDTTPPFAKPPATT